MPVILPSMSTGVRFRTPLTLSCAATVQTCVSFSLQGHLTENDRKFSAPNSEPAPFGILVDRAVALCSARWRFFLCLSLIVLVAEGLLALLAGGIIGELVATTLFPPFIVAGANIAAATAIAGEVLSWQAILRRALPRLPAIILIDLLVQYIVAGGLIGVAQPESIEQFSLSCITLLLGSTLLFADVYASIETDTPWRLVPFGFMRSIRLSWENGNIIRIAYLGALQIPVALLTVMTQQILGLHHVAGAQLIADLPIPTLLAAPFSVLTTVVYFDCLAREGRTTS